MEISLMSAPLTAAVGLLTAYLIVRQRFVGRNVFEFALMLELCYSGHGHRRQLHHGASTCRRWK